MLCFEDAWLHAQEREKFSDDEVFALINAVDPLYEKLFSSINNSCSISITKSDKERIWDRVTHNINSVWADVIRTKENVKDKWS